MRKTSAIITLGGLLPFLLGGCFSAIARMGGGWNGTKTSTGVKVAAGAADVVTLPAQAPMLVIAGVTEVSRRSALATRKERINAIRKDPEIIFREKWHVGSSSSVDAVYEALADHGIAFTDQQLRRLYQEMDSRRVYVVGNPHCSVEFLRTVWEPMVQKGLHSDRELREQLVRNPTTPIEWLEQMAAHDNAVGVRYSLAASMLEQRKRAAPAASAPAGEGKR